MGIFDKLKSGAAKVGSGIKWGAGKTWSGTKWGAGKTWSGTKWGAGKTWSGTKWGATKTGEGASWLARKNIASPGANQNYFPSISPKAVGGAVVGAAAATAVGTKKALAVPSFFLLILGFIKFLFFNGGNSSIGLLLSICLFCIAGYALAQKLERYGRFKLNLFLPMIYFVVWYFMFKGNYDPEFLAYFIASLAAITLAIALFTKGKGVFPEVVGIVPAIFLFLDIGMLPFLVDKYGLAVTPIMEGLLIWMPWWSLLGLLTLPEEVSDNYVANALIGIFRILGYLYIIFVFVSPWVPELAYTEALVPGPEEISQAQQNIEQRIPTVQNPAIARFACLFSGEITDVEGCVKRKQTEKEIELFCTEVEGLKKGSPAFDECQIQEQERRKGLGAAAEGTIDQTIKIPTSAKIIFHKDSFPQLTGDVLPFPIELQITNPRRLPISIQPECFFQNSGGEIFNGKLETGSQDKVITSSEETFSNYWLCYPEQGVTLTAGRYTLLFKATLGDLTSQSRLQRAFVGSISREEKERLIKEEISKVITITETQVPAEFAGIYFDIGHLDADPIIEYSDPSVENQPDKPVILKSYIKNMGSGKIINVKNYEIDLQGLTPKIDYLQSDVGRTWQGDCRQGSVPNAYSYKRDIPIPTCFIADFPEELKNPDDDLEWVSKEFRASLKYDYLLEAKQGFELIELQDVVG